MCVWSIDNWAFQAEIQSDCVANLMTNLVTSSQK